MLPTLVPALALSCLGMGCIGATLAAAWGPSQASPTAADPGDSPVSEARANARAHADVGAGQHLVADDTVVDPDGTSHVRFDRTYRGLDVVGGDLVVHQSEDGDFQSLSGGSLKPFQASTEAAVPAPAAARTAAATVDLVNPQTRSDLVVLAADRAPTLAWRVDVTGRNPDGSPAGEYVFVGARTGRVVDRWPSVLEETGSGTGLIDGRVALETKRGPYRFRMVDPTRGGNATYNGPLALDTRVFKDRDNVWSDGSESNPKSAGVDAHYGISETWDFYKYTYGRVGIADDGVGARSFVHDGDYVNASWSDSCFCIRYGDGDTTIRPLVALDVAGHEMSHGVTSRTAGLIYEGEPGGLNEATSDIFGTMVEWYADNAVDVPDYVVGEEIFRSYDPATHYIRRMDRPSLDGNSPDCWTPGTGSLDVHYSSGPANHFFYLLAEGSGAKTINGIAYDSPTCDGSTVTGIGHDAAAAIWYRALTVYLTSDTGYAGARTATVDAATDLYGSASSEVAVVEAAWSAVDVG